MPIDQKVPVVVIGLSQKRGIHDIPPIFENTPYNVAACMGLTDVPEGYRYSPQNLAVILHNLHPRPRALLVGIAVDPSYAKSAEAVWAEYVDSVLKHETDTARPWHENICVSLPRTHFVDPEKPEIWAEVRRTWKGEMFRQMDAVFRPS